MGGNLTTTRDVGEASSPRRCLGKGMDTGPAVLAMINGRAWRDELFDGGWEEPWAGREDATANRERCSRRT